VTVPALARRLLGALIAVTVVWTTERTSQARDDISVKDVLAHATSYLADYQRQLGFVLADERATQQAFDGARRLTAERRTSGEFFVTFLPADHAWISVHDTIEVDGRTVTDREDLRELLAREPLLGAVRVLVERNARYNIGNISRNFNEPTLALLTLEPSRRSQLRFSRVRVDHDAGVDVVTLKFKETDAPSLVHGTNGQDVFSTGEMAIEAGTGRVRRTLIRFDSASTVATLTTTYAREPKLDLWVPVTMAERYERMKSPHDLVTVETAYSNYRRFDVNIRIK
jgi:hypothetical protein